MTLEAVGKHKSKMIKRDIMAADLSKQTLTANQNQNQNHKKIIDAQIIDQRNQDHQKQIKMFSNLQHKMEINNNEKMSA